MKLTSRLKSVASLVDKGSTVLDVGCDHAYLSIYLVENNIAHAVVASDNKEGPLEQATKNIKQKKLTENIKTKLGNGIETVEDSIDTVIIAGMGGRTINGIVKNDIRLTKKIETFIVQPNNYQMDVRKCFMKLGFYLDKEIIVKEKKYFYQVMKFKKGKKKYSKKELFFGPKLLENKDNVFIEYYKKEASSRKILLQLLPKSFRMKRWKTKREINMIIKEIEN